MILINSSPKDAAKVFQRFLPISVPIGVGFLISALERAGIRAACLDEQVEDHVLDRVAEHVKTMEKPYIFGFSVLTAALKNAVILSKQLRQLYPDSKIVFGGIHPTALPDEVLAYDHIDAVIRREGERPLAEFYRHVKAGTDISSIDGLSYKKNGAIIHNKMSPAMKDLSAEPPFPYHLFTNKRYDLGFIMSSRGCPYDCIFCSNRITTGKKYRYRPADILVQELEELYTKYGKRSVTFLDDNFLVSKPRIYRLINEIRAKGLHEKMNFTFQARGDNADEKLMRDLFDVGFHSVFFGMETANPEMMKTIKKRETVEDCVNAVQIARKIGYHVSATFIYALPGDTHKDRMDCVTLSNDLKIDLVRYNNATPYPGTELYEIAKCQGRLFIQGIYENFISTSTFTESPFKPVPFSYVPPGNTEEEI
ncbi:MAG: B12-binding domain-containing radical SAM protein, partial [Nitrospirae bacterium]|nr:B12-binding domain-containing radical SAM protein [Nitrospirota bacterium]